MLHSCTKLWSQIIALIDNQYMNWLCGTVAMSHPLGGSRRWSPENFIKDNLRFHTYNFNFILIYFINRKSLLDKSMWIFSYKPLFIIVNYCYDIRKYSFILRWTFIYFVYSFCVFIILAGSPWIELCDHPSYDETNHFLTKSKVLLMKVCEISYFVRKMDKIKQKRICRRRCPPGYQK